MAKRYVALQAIILVVVLVNNCNVLACGLDWTLPGNHFEGVDPHGYVSYWERIGEVDFGDGLNLPLQVNFNSGRELGRPSRYLGAGWLFPLLESRFVQWDEDHFYMLQPDGLNNLFVRTEANGTILDGSAGWKAEIRGDVITAWAACGWKLVFASGRVTSMSTPKGRRFDWVYEDERVSEIREGGVTRIKAKAAANGHLATLDLADGQRVVFSQDKKPRVQNVGGQNVIVGVEDCLSGTTLLNGEKRSYTFGTDQKTMPTLQVDNTAINENDAGTSKHPRVLTWNPETKFIVRDDDWTYQIKQYESSGDNVEIGRTNTGGQKQQWFVNTKKGEETTLDVNGVKTVKTWYVSGFLEGKTRKIEEVNGGQKHLVYQAFYDDQGNLFRKHDRNLTYIFDRGQLIKVLKDNKEWIVLQVDPKTGLSSILEAGSVIWPLK